VAVFEDLQQIMALLLIQGGQAKVIEHQKIGFGKLCEQLQVSPITFARARSSKSLLTLR